MKIIFFLLFIGATMLSAAQSKSTLVEKNVKMIRTLEQDVDQGEKKLLLEKEEFFDENGELVEIKEYDEKGRIKDWQKYKYSSEGKLIEETTLNFKGGQKERIIQIFKNGLKTEKLYYDDKNRLYKKKKYEYEHR